MEQNQKQFVGTSTHFQGGFGVEASSQKFCPLCACPKYCFLTPLTVLQSEGGLN